MDIHKVHIDPQIIFWTFGFFLVFDFIHEFNSQLLYQIRWNPHLQSVVRFLTIIVLGGFDLAIQDA